MKAEAESDLLKYGWIPEWPNGADCKSAGFYLRWFESISTHFSRSFAEFFVNDLWRKACSPEADAKVLYAEIAQLIEH